MESTKIKLTLTVDKEAFRDFMAKLIEISNSLETLQHQIREMLEAAYGQSLDQIPVNTITPQKLAEDFIACVQKAAGIASHGTAGDAAR